MQPLDPIAFQLGPIAVHWYGMIMASAILIGFMVDRERGEKTRFKS